MQATTTIAAPKLDPALTIKVYGFLIVSSVADTTVDKTGSARFMPTGPMYAALMGRMTLHQFNQFISHAVAAGYLERDGHHCVAATDAGRAWVAKTREWLKRVHNLDL